MRTSRPRKYVFIAMIVALPALAGVSTFEVKNFQVARDTKVSAELAYKGFLSAHAKGIENSNMLVSLNDDKSRHVVLRGDYDCVSSGDQPTAYKVQSSVDVRFTDKKVKFSFEKVVFAGNAPGVTSTSPEETKTEAARSCVMAMIDDYLKQIGDQ